MAPADVIKKQPDASITLTFAAARPVQHKQIKKRVESSPGSWTHHVVIEKDADFTDIVREWLKEARAFGEQTKKMSVNGFSAPS